MAHAGVAIRAVRRGAGLGVRQLAAMSGTSYSYLSQVERGIRVPTERWLRSVEETLAAHIKSERDAA